MLLVMPKDISFLQVLNLRESIPKQFFLSDLAYEQHKNEIPQLLRLEIKRNVK